MILALLGLAAAQDLPDRLALTLEEGTGIDGLIASPDADWFAWLESGSGEVRVLDADTWETTAVAVCGDHGGSPVGLAASTDPDSGELGLYTGCSDGTVERLGVVAGDPTLDDAGAITVSDRPILGLAGDDDGLIIAVEPEDGTGVDLHAATWGTDLDDASDVTVALATPTRDGFEALGLTAGTVLVLHGGQYATEVIRASGAAVSVDTNGVSRDWVDVTTDGGSEIYVADTDGVVGFFQSGDNEINTLLGSAQGLDQLSALVLQPDGDDAYLAVAESSAQELRLFPFTGATVGTDLLQTLDGADSVYRMAVVDDVLAAGTTDGRVLLFTDDPWVTITDAPSADLASGDSGTVSFDVDLGGDWSLRLGSVTGSELDSGDVDDGGSATASFTVDDDFAEGQNRLFVVVDDGHDAVDIQVDDPPGDIGLTQDDLAFGDQSITLNFAALSDGDIASYDVYFSTTAFAAADHATGGPDFTEGDLTSPVQAVEDGAGGVSLTLTPLTNDTLYYVAVRATDTSGQEGPMSSVFEVTPEPVAGAAVLSGEQGGFFACSTPGALGGGFALVLAGLVSLGRRRSAAIGLVGLLSLVSSGTAHALPPLLDLGVDDGDRKTQAVALDVGPAWFTDTDLTNVYGTEGMKDFRLSRDWQWYRMVGVSASLGLMSDEGEQLGVTTGSASGQVAKLKVVPVRLGGVFRLDLFDGQPVVPMLTVGLDYLLRWETTSFDSTDPFSSERLGGGKGAWDWGVGLELLLDGFEPGRAEGALARWGIYDTYLTVRYEQLRLLPGPAINDQGLDFGHSGVSVGLRLDR